MTLLSLDLCSMYRPIYTVRNADPNGQPSNVDDGPLKGESGTSVHMQVAD